MLKAQLGNLFCDHGSICTRGQIGPSAERINRKISCFFTERTVMHVCPVAFASFCQNHMHCVAGTDGEAMHDFCHSTIWSLACVHTSWRNVKQTCLQNAIKHSKQENYSMLGYCQYWSTVVDLRPRSATRVLQVVPLQTTDISLGALRGLNTEQIPNSGHELVAKL